MNVTELKEKLLTSLDMWADARISDMVKENPALAIPSAYMKRASHNIIAKHKDIGTEHLVKYANHLALDLLKDKDGVYDIREYFLK